ncbi:MAG: family 20 glycosylhydrolase [Micromonosporaceae bacterium]
MAFPVSRRRRHQAYAATAFLLASTGLTWAATTPASAQVASMQDVVPAPVSVQPASGITYTLPADATIYADPPATDVGNYLAGILRPSTGYALPVTAAGSGDPTSGISLLLSGADGSVGQEGYQLDVNASRVVIRAQTATGLFHGVQTLRQLLPAEIESATPQSGPWTVPGGSITDYPRFAYRGTMLDVARHFHPVATLKRHIDRMALYKINTFHLHLSDDQGWRIVVDTWPRLATYGGSTQVGGGPGGYYTKAQYTDIVAYAKARHITVVPEIDMPGHTNAALASYAELNCNGQAPPLYTGIEVGFSSLCTTKEVTYTFVKDVLTELAALTPGPYLHIGGDEANVTPHDQYAAFLNRVQPMVPAQNKRVMGWHQIGAPDVQHSPDRIVQYWGLNNSDSLVSSAVSRGAKVVMSPANRAYLDMKYNASTPLGLSWAGYIEVQRAYDWNPGSHLSGVPESAVLGVEAPLWTETIVTEEHIEYMAFPRLPTIAELGWSPWSTHNWDAFKTRLGAQGPRWTVMGIDFYRSPQVPWGSSPSSPPPTGVCTVPGWQSSQVYVGGDMVSWQGRKYTAKWWTQGEQPDTHTGDGQPWRDDGACAGAPSPTTSPTPSPTVSPTVSPTASPTTPPGTYPAWQPNTAYQVGDQVSYNGRNYQCRQAHTSLVGWEPPNTPALWLEIT